MKAVEAVCEISAAPEQVWQVLTDFSSYFQWNPYIVRARGEAAVGSSLEVTYRQPGGKDVTIRPRITVLREPHDLRWAARSLLPGLMDGEHSIVVESFDGGLCCVAQRKVFSGLAEKRLSGTLEEHSRLQLEAMNDALKRRAERSSVPAAPEPGL